MRKMYNKVRDMSPTGIGLYSTEPLEAGTNCEVDLKIPSGDVHRQLTVSVTVVRCAENIDKNRDAYPHLLGCRFNETLPDDVQKWMDGLPLRY